MPGIKWSKILPKPNTEVADICMGNLKKYWAKKLTLDEFTKEQNYVYLMCVDELKYVSNPEAPISYSEYLGNKGKPKFDGDAFRKDHPEIELWLNKTSHITWENFRNACTLEGLIKYFSSLGDMTSSSKVGIAYSSYPSAIQLGDRQIWKKISSL